MADAAIQQSDIAKREALQNLNRVKQAFDRWDSLRLSLLHKKVSERQWQFVELLPSLLHDNWRGMPGWISAEAPCGIAGFSDSQAVTSPEQQGLQALNHARTHSPAIQLVYIETAAYQLMPLLDQEQLILTIFCEPGLATNERALMEQKLDSLILMAEDFDWALKVHCYFEPEIGAFEQPDMDYLYSRGLRIAGLRPLWQLQAPGELSSDFPDAEQIKSVTKEVFWHAPTVNSADSSLLGSALQYWRAYDLTPHLAWHFWRWVSVAVSGHVAALSASERLKLTIYQYLGDETAQDEEEVQAPVAEECLFWDAELMLLTSVEETLMACGDAAGCEQLRAAFVAALEGRGETAGIIQQQLKSVWQVADRKAANDFSSARNAMIDSVCQLNGYVARKPALAEFFVPLKNAKQHLQALYANKPGKLLWSGSAWSDDVPLTLRKNQEWQLCRDGQSVLSAPGLLQLIVYAHYWSVPLTQLSFDGQLSAQVRAQAARLLQAIPNQLPVMSRNATGTKPNLWVIANLGQPMRDLSGKALSLAMNTAGAFRTGKQPALVTSLSVLYLAADGELVCRYFDGPAGLLNGVSYCIEQMAANTVSPELTVNCYEADTSVAQLIERRIREMVQNIHGCFYQSRYGENARYIQQLGRQFVIVQSDKQQLKFKGARSEDELVQRLTLPGTRFSPIVLDRYTRIDPYFMVVCQSIEADNIQVFYHLLDADTAQVYVADEAGGLYRQQIEFRGEASLLKPMDDFLQSIIQRRRHAQLTEANAQSLAQSYASAKRMLVNFYRIEASGSEQPRAVPVHMNAGGDYRPGLLLQAIGQLQSDGALAFNIYCDQQLFLAADWGDELYPAVARLIMARRKSRERYACRLTDIDLSGLPDQLEGAQVKTLDFLRHKAAIEDQINQAITRV